jgi:hypothetical protein
MRGLTGGADLAPSSAGCARVMSDNSSLSHKAALDAGARALLGRQLRSYYDRLRQTTVSDSLAQLLHQFETGALDGDDKRAPNATSAADN